MATAGQRNHREIERQFPVRVRLAVPPGGFDRQLTVMYAWLDDTCGRDGWRSTPAGLAGILNDAVAFHFEDAAFAHAFVNRFCCGYRPVAVNRAAIGAFSLREDLPVPPPDMLRHKIP